MTSPQRRNTVIRSDRHESDLAEFVGLPSRSPRPSSPVGKSRGVTEEQLRCNNTLMKLEQRRLSQLSYHV